jgi:hypothetical protein
MKALTVLQPWATLIIAGAKPYEFRSWRPPAAMIGQRIVIHAAKRKIDQAEVVALFSLLRDGPEKRNQNPAVIETCLDAEKGLPILDRAWLPSEEPLHLGAGVGTAVIGEPRAAEEIAEELGVPRVNDSTRDKHAVWAWPMLDPEHWRAPVTMPGALNLWNWPEPEDVLGLHPVSRPAKCHRLPSAARSLQSSPGRASSAPAAARR